MKDEFIRGKPEGEVKATMFSFSTLAIPSLLVLSGLWLSTQTFAKYFNYDPSIVGYPFYVFKKIYPLYFPWLFPAWGLKYWIHPEFGPAFYIAKNPALILSAAGLALFFIIALTRRFFLSTANFYGTARWAFWKDLKQKGFLEKEGVVLGELDEAELVGKIVNGEEQLQLIKPAQLICMKGRSNVLGFAPTGSGKGICWAYPTAISYPSSMFFFDPKAQLYNKTAGYRSTFSRIFRFSPVDRESLGINLLMEIPPGDNAFRYAQMIAENFTAPKSGKVDEAGEYFATAAQNLLLGGILHVRCGDYEDKSLYGVLKMFNGAVQDSSDTSNGGLLMQSWIDSIHCTEGIHDHVVMAAREYLATNEKERPTILKVVTNALSVFKDDVVRINTSRNDFSIKDFWETEVPISFYFTVPYGDIPRLSPLIRVLITFILQRLSDGETSYGKARLKIDLLMFLDEFAALGAIKKLKESMSIMREYNVFFFLICQSLTQLSDLYGDNHPFLEHCKTQVIFAPGILKTAEELSRMIGKESVNKKSLSTPTKLIANGGNISDSETERNLINADELMKLSITRLIVLSHGMPPYKGKKVVSYQDPRFKDFTNEEKYPAPANRQALLSYCTLRKPTAEDAWFNLPRKSVLQREDLEDYDEALIDPYVSTFRNSKKIEKEESGLNVSNGNIEESFIMRSL